MLESHDLRGLVEDIWSSLFEVPLDRDAPLPEDVVTAFVDISGGWSGRVLVATTTEGALALASHMLHVPESVVEEADLADAIGELANIVGGSVKSCVDGQCALSLPNVSRYSPGAPAQDALEVLATWNTHPLCIRVAPARPLIPSRRMSTEGEKS
jgi:chemotaxis protein CheY-P-specific phosphatase CheC